MRDRLRPLWDFDDLDATVVRFRDQLVAESSAQGRAEVLTQLARIEGLGDVFEAGARFLDEAEALAGTDPLVRVRIELERGRLLRSSGDPRGALPLFEAAFARALEIGEYFHAADAAHMAAIAASGREAFIEWTRRGIDLAQTHEEAAHWEGPLRNNLGWEYFEAGEYAAALGEFEGALRARERDPQDPGAIAIAEYAVGKALRGLGRNDEAIPLLEHAVAWTRSAGAPDGWFHEELAQEYAEVGRADEAAEQARTAVPLLLAADPSFADDNNRVARMQVLAGPEPGSAQT